MTTESPCKNICQYEEFEGTPMCIACYRTYDDLEVWFNAGDDEKKRITKECKKREKRYHE